MLRDGRHAHVEWLGKLGDRAFARKETGQDCPASRIRQGGKRGAQPIARKGAARVIEIDEGERKAGFTIVVSPWSKRRSPGRSSSMTIGP